MALCLWPCVRWFDYRVYSAAQDAALLCVLAELPEVMLCYVVGEVCGDETAPICPSSLGLPSDKADIP